MNLCLFFSLGSRDFGCKQTGEKEEVLDCNSQENHHLLSINVLALGLTAPTFGRTQYFLGAVVLILNSCVESVGFVNLIVVILG